MTRAVLFDVDGVLVDSYRAHFESWLKLAAENGVAFTEPQFAATFGRTSRDIIAELWPTPNLGDDEIRRLDDRKEALFRTIIDRDFPAMEGAVELIDALAADGFALAVGSSGPPKNVSLVLDRLDRRAAFGSIITGMDVTRGKPDPQVYLLAAERLGVAAARCAVVEDAPAGIDAAHAAGMVAIALASTGRTIGELHAADLVVQSLRELTPQRIGALIEARHRR